MAIRVVSTSAWVFDESLSSRVMTIPLEAAAPGDVAFIKTAGFTLLANNLGEIVVPDGWTTLWTQTGTGGWNTFLTGRIPDGTTQNITLVRDGDTPTEIGWWAQSIVVRGVTESDPYWEDFDVLLGVSVNEWALQPMDVLGDDRLVMHYLYILCNSGVISQISPTGGWNLDRLVVLPILQGSIAGAALSQEANTDTAAGNVLVDTPAANTAGVVLSATLIPAPESTPTFANPRRLRLGCPDSYNVWITDASYRNTLDKVGWSSLNWSRSLDEISTAGARLPDHLGGAYCVEKFGGIETWKFGLLIERNDQRVWSGPITSMTRGESDLVLGASDVLARTTKRPAIYDDDPVIYTSIDAGDLFARIVNLHSASPSDPYRLVAPDVDVGVFTDRTLRPRQGSYAWPLLEELMGSSVDAFMALDTLYVWDPRRGWMFVDIEDGVTRVLPGPYNSVHDMEFGTFTNAAFTTRPKWGISGDFQTNFVISTSADSGEEGFRRFKVAEDVPSQAEVGVLFYVDTDPFVQPGGEEIDLPDSVLQRRADTVLALRRKPPAVIAGGVLSESAPVDINNLWPGSIWRLDVHDSGYRQLLQAGRLKRVEVSVTASDNGLEESIVPTLYPIGWAEGA